MHKKQKEIKMALQLNDLKITPRVGAYVYMPNVPQPHNCVVSSNQATALIAGDIVTVDTSVANAHCPVIKKAAVDDPIFGVIPSDVRKNSYVAGEKAGEKSRPVQAGQEIKITGHSQDVGMSGFSFHICNESSGTQEE